MYKSWARDSSLRPAMGACALAMALQVKPSPIPCPVLLYCCTVQPHEPAVLAHVAGVQPGGGGRRRGRRRGRDVGRGRHQVSGADELGGRPQLRLGRGPAVSLAAPRGARHVGLPACDRLGARYGTCRPCIGRRRRDFIQTPHSRTHPPGGCSCACGGPPCKAGRLWRCLSLCAPCLDGTTAHRPFAACPALVLPPARAPARPPARSPYSPTADVSPAVAGAGAAATSPEYSPGTSPSLSPGQGVGPAGGQAQDAPYR